MREGQTRSEKCNKTAQTGGFFVSDSNLDQVMIVKVMIVECFPYRFFSRNAASQDGASFDPMWSSGEMNRGCCVWLVYQGQERP